MNSSFTASSIAAPPEPASDHEAGQAFDGDTGGLATRADAGHSMNRRTSPVGRLESATQTAPHKLWFASVRWKTGVRRAVEGAFLIGGGVFLGISGLSLPDFVWDTTILATAGVLGGAWLVILAVRDLCGYVQIDQFGLAVRSGLSTCTISWHDLEAWEIVGETTPGHLPPPQLKLWKSNAAEPYLLDMASLAPGDRQILRQALEDMAPLG